MDIELCAEEEASHRGIPSLPKALPPSVQAGERGIDRRIPERGGQTLGGAADAVRSVRRADVESGEQKRILKTASSYCSSGINFMISLGVQSIILQSFSTVDVEMWQCLFIL